MHVRYRSRVCLCATLPSQETTKQWNVVVVVSGPSSEASGWIVLGLLARSGLVHPRNRTCIGDFRRRFSGSQRFENRLLVTAPWRTCFSVEAGPRPRRNALCVGLERFVKRSHRESLLTRVFTTVFRQKFYMKIKSRLYTSP